LVIYDVGAFVGTAEIDDIFGVYRSRDEALAGPANPLLCAEVTHIYASHCLVRLPRGSHPIRDLGSVAVALHLSRYRRLGDLKIHVPEDFPDMQLINRAIQLTEASSIWGITRVSREKAMIGVVYNAKEGPSPSLSLEILDREILALGLRYLKFSIPALDKDLADTLSASAHFFHHLRRKPDSTRRKPLKVSLHVHKMERIEEAEGDFARVLKWNIQSVDKSKPSASPWTVIADGKSLYGVELKNGTTEGMYASTLSFDCGSLEISEFRSMLSYCSALSHVQGSCTIHPPYLSTVN